MQMKPLQPPVLTTLSKFLLTAMTLGGLAYGYQKQTETVEHVLVTDITSDNQGGAYVDTDHGFYVVSNDILNSWQATDITTQLEEGHFYKITKSGFSIPFIHDGNIIKAVEEKPSRHMQLRNR